MLSLLLLLPFNISLVGTVCSF